PEQDRAGGQTPAGGVHPPGGERSDPQAGIRADSRGVPSATGFRGGCRRLVVRRGVEGLRQYEIWWADLPGPAGRRPVLLLSRDGAYAFLSKVVAAEITTTIRRIAIEVPLGAAEGLPRK